MKSDFHQAYYAYEEARGRAGPSQSLLVSVPEHNEWFVSRTCRTKEDWAELEKNRPEIRSFDKARIAKGQLLEDTESPYASLLISFGEESSIGALKMLIDVNKDVGADMLWHWTNIIATDPVRAERCIENIEHFTEIFKKEPPEFSFFGRGKKDVQEEPALPPGRRLKLTKMVADFFSAVHEAAATGRALPPEESALLANTLSAEMNSGQLGKFIGRACRYYDAPARSFMFLDSSPDGFLPPASEIVANYWPMVQAVRPDLAGIKNGPTYLMTRAWTEKNAPLLVNAKAETARLPRFMLTS